ncbi:MAG: hypothetical protein WDW38_011432 [Sanguina aurantia]
MNKESKRETPAVVNFGDKMRFLGTDGAAKQGLAPQNTIHQLKRLLGKRWSDPMLQADIKRMPFNVIEGPDGGLQVEVMYCNEKCKFTPEQLMAIVLVDLKHIAETEGKITVTDCAISVPTFYSEAERYAMLDAARIAGLNCLRLINETTAIALAYGIFKTDLPEVDPVHVVFVDVGHSATQVSIVSLKKTGLVVRSHAWDRNLGGRDFDEAIFDHFCAEFKTKHKIDIAANKKSSFKLRAALEKALADSGLTVEDISSVEIVGSSTRIPSVYQAVEDVFKMGPSRTLNSKECVSRGAALQCAMLSPVFKVREFDVADISPFTINFGWERDGAPFTQAIFSKGEKFPCSKMVSLTRGQAFDITASYSDDSDVPAGFSKVLGVYHVGPFSVPAGSEGVKLKAKLALNLHGLVSVQAVHSFEEEMVAEEGAAEASKDSKMEEAAEGPEHEGPTPMEAEAPAAAKGKKKVTKTEVPFTASQTAGFSKSQFDLCFEREAQMQAADRLQEETNERKNALEGYVYGLRNKLSDERAYASFVSHSDKESINVVLSAMEDWLYDEGDDTTKSVYIAKLEELKKVGAPVEQRAAESESRPLAANMLKSTAAGYLAVARSEAPRPRPP